jgi:trehalose 6-phosphate synthase
MAAERRKLIVVANRGPATYERAANGTRIARRGGGGLVTALRGFLDRHDVTWIASAMSEEDRVVVLDNNGAAFDEISREGSSFRLRLVAHDARAYDWFYNVVANPTLWFLQHYLWDLKQAPRWDRGLRRAWEEGYVAVNRSFAEAVAVELDREPDAAVFLHDYHLYLAPRMIREARPDATLAQFIHIPWPQSDQWRVLPAPIRSAIHDGLLANDVIGFHSERWRRNFVRACHDILEVDSGPVRNRTVVAPISVDPEEFDDLAASDAVLAAERQIVARRPERLVLRVDRTDPSKNVVGGFQAFEAYLDAHPEARGRVGMLALLDPSRQDIPDYAEYLGAIQRAARAVNDRFQEDGWIPIDLQIRDDFAQTVAAYKQYDVLLVNAIYDGLNLVAKEGPLVNERDGVLLLSENAGAHAELGPWALTVNPFDLSGQAEAIHTALEMPAADRGARIEAIREYVREHDLSSWVEAQLAALDAVSVPSRG